MADAAPPAGGSLDSTSVAEVLTGFAAERRSGLLPLHGADPRLMALDPVEWQVIAAMPEEGTVAEVIGGSGLSAFTVFDVLHRLVRRGLVQAVTGDAPAP